MKLTKVILKYQETYLLVRKSHMIKTSDYEGVWEVVGGKFEENESPQEAITREIIEEIGVCIPDLKLLHTFSNSLFSSIFVFFKDLDEKPTITLSSEHIEYKWCSVEEIKNLEGVIYKEFFLELIKKTTSLQ